MSTHVTSNTLKILLIDDSEADYVLAREYLNRQPDYAFEIDWESSYESGLKKIVKSDYDACLLDYNIGPESGLDLAKQARNEGCQSPIILFSGLDRKKIKQLSDSSHTVEGFLSKDDLSAERIIEEMRSISVNRQNGFKKINDSAPVQDMDEAHISQFILENLPDPIMVLDKNCEITMVNRIFSELMALPPEELLGVNASVFLNCRKEELIQAIDKNTANRQFRNPIKAAGKRKTHILWDFIKPEATPDQSFAIIAKGALGRKQTKQKPVLGNMAKMMSHIFKNPAYYKVNDMYFRKDLFK